jgi:hypothetical protein
LVEPTPVAVEECPFSSLIRRRPRGKPAEASTACTSGSADLPPLRAATPQAAHRRQRLGVASTTKGEVERPQATSSSRLHQCASRGAEERAGVGQPSPRRPPRRRDLRRYLSIPKTSSAAMPALGRATRCRLRDTPKLPCFLKYAAKQLGWAGRARRIVPTQFNGPRDHACRRVGLRGQARAGSPHAISVSAQTTTRLQRRARARSC